MPMHDDGDPVRGLGFVTLYAAYVEENVDLFVSVLFHDDKDSRPRIRRAPVSAKIRYCKQRLNRYAPLPAELAQYPEFFDYLAALFEERNEVIHGRIYGTMGGGPDQLRSGREGVPDREITSAALYELANRLGDCCGALARAHMFALPRLIGPLLKART